MNRNELDYNPDIVDGSVMVQQGIEVEDIFEESTPFSFLDSDTETSTPIVVIGGLGRKEV